MTEAEYERTCIELAADIEREAANAANRLARQLEALASNREAELARDESVRGGAILAVLQAGDAVGQAWVDLFRLMREVQATGKRPLVPKDDGGEAQ